MKPIRIAAAMVNQTPLDWGGNRRRLLACIAQAKEQRADLLCLPELALTGYGCEDQFLAPSTAEQALGSLQELLPATSGLVVAVGLPIRYHNAIYNTVALIADGSLVGFYAKQNLAGDGLHYESRWFREWPKGIKGEVEVFGRQVPIGDCIFDVGEVRIGFEICEDAWVADRPGRKYAELGVDLILNPSASHFAFGKQKIREQFVREGSRAFGAVCVYSNLVGNEAGRIVYDGGAMIASHGEVVSRGERFSFCESKIVTAVVDLEVNRLAQAKIFSREVELRDFEAVECKFPWNAAFQVHAKAEDPPMSKEVEFTKAVTLALFDYMRKSYSRGFVVSLSGGADSAAVACLVSLMHRFVTEELDAEEIGQKLAYLGGGLPKLSELLTCVYQATENSGQTTQNAAKVLAESLGANFSQWNVQGTVEQYCNLAEGTIGRALTWEQDDLTLQNIQARVRAPGVWMLANIKNALLLSTSNRSEAAVGYATMDGDTCGGLSPIAGIDKAFLREWLEWLETKGSEEVPRIPELKVINQQQPTAELRPQSEGQTDEEDLMPYPILDKIERLAIRDKKSPREVYDLLIPKFSDYEPLRLKKCVVRFFQLWSRNQWKRERYAPSFHLDDENLDPKTWCRFPILSAGFAEELAELQQED